MKSKPFDEVTSHRWSSVLPTGGLSSRSVSDKALLATVTEVIWDTSESVPIAKRS